MWNVSSVFCHLTRLFQEELFLACVEWARVHAKSSSDGSLEQLLRQFVPHLRWTQMSPLYVKKHVRPTNALTSDELMVVLEYFSMLAPGGAPQEAEEMQHPLLVKKNARCLKQCFSAALCHSELQVSADGRRVSLSALAVPG
jgi:hypothetical protein